MWQTLLVIVGLCVFEIVSSLDNAVVNADVLAGMSKKWRKWFLVWGIFFSVFLVRGLLPWLIVYWSHPSLGLIQAFTASYSDNPAVKAALEESAPALLMGGGVFLLFLFLHWLFLEERNFGLSIEESFGRQGVWFFALVSVILSALVWVGIHQDPILAFAASTGASAFFITHGFKEHAAKVELTLKTKGGLSDFSKLVYLEILDATFSIDGVVGAFAFTMSVPLIILGNGLGAIVVRELTIKGVDEIKKYPYLKNGAMYSIFCLSLVMLAEGLGFEIAPYWTPLVTMAVIGYFLAKSIKTKNASLLAG